MEVVDAAAGGPEPARCDGETLATDPPQLSADVACYPSCPRAGVPVPFRVVNCTGHPVVVHELGRRDGFAHILELEGTLEQRIEAGTRSAEFRLRVAGPFSGSVGLSFVTVGAVEPTPRVIEVAVDVTDSLLSAAIEECSSRGDFWGLRGKSGSARCWKVMKDEGKACHDGRDCEGQCLLERERVVSAKQKRVEGRCSRFEHQTGCFTIIGSTNRGLLPRAERLPRICAD